MYIHQQNGIGALPIGPRPDYPTYKALPSWTLPVQGRLLQAPNGIWALVDSRVTPPKMPPIVRAVLNLDPTMGASPAFIESFSTDPWQWGELITVTGPVYAPHNWRTLKDPWLNWPTHNIAPQSAVSGLHEPDPYTTYFPVGYGPAGAEPAPEPEPEPAEPASLPTEPEPETGETAPNGTNGGWEPEGEADANGYDQDDESFWEAPEAGPTPGPAPSGGPSATEPEPMPEPETKRNGRALLAAGAALFFLPILLDRRR